MNGNAYSDSKSVPLDLPHFPTRQQAFIWRNWGIIPVEKLAAVMEADEADIRTMAGDMGIPAIKNISKYWLEYGAVTIIRRNWHLIPYGQLIRLLDCTLDELFYKLKEEDFLWCKLGNAKPDTAPIRYEPLSRQQRAETLKLKLLVQKYFPEAGNESWRPFEFIDKFREKPIPPWIKNYPGAQNDEVELDAAWRIGLVRDTERTSRIVNRFIRTHEARWGIVPGQGTGNVKHSNFIIDIAPEAFPGGIRESYKLRVGNDRIEIKASDGSGVLRALQWLEKQMELRGAPVLKQVEKNCFPSFDLRMVYPYFINYGDPFNDKELRNIPEGLFSAYSERGINAIWLHAVLYTLVPWEKTKELSIGFEKRLAVLRRVCERAGDFGIGVYLYLNEPRSMKLPFFEKYPDWKGILSRDGDTAALCTSSPEVRDYLRRGTAYVFERVPELAGVFTITKSENMTSCWSHDKGDLCPRCRNRGAHEVVAEVNNLIASGVHSVKPDARVIAWTWGWDDRFMDIRKTINLFSPDLEVMCTSEEWVPTKVGGIDGFVVDYSMANIGPGEKAEYIWQTARDRGLKTCAKIQINNSWEFCFVPYLPAMNLVNEHVKRLKDTGVDGLMESWSLGGYPSLNMELAAMHYWEDGNRGKEDQLRSFAVSKYGETCAPYVLAAWRAFSRALAEYPFHWEVLYFAPHNSGPMNLLYEMASGRKATMTGLPYDDLKRWRAIYPEEIFEKQWQKLSRLWKTGLNYLSSAKSQVKMSGAEELASLETVAAAVCLHFRSTYCQVRYIRLRDQFNDKATSPAEREKIRKQILYVLRQETDNAKNMYLVALKDSRIGFEAANHYLYTPLDFMEKVLNCNLLYQRFKNKQD